MKLERDILGDRESRWGLEDWRGGRAEWLDQTKSTYENAIRNPLPCMLIKNKPAKHLEQSGERKTQIIQINKSSATQG